MRIPHVKFLCAGVLIIAGICYLMLSGISDSMVYYYSVPEVKTKHAELASRGIRVSGHVLPGSINKHPDGTRLQFTVYDRQSGQSLPVNYQGLVPDTFKEEAEVVVEGTYDSSSESFGATTLLAKCPSKYEGRADSHPDQIPQDEKAVSAR
jgi:cytochrome c-type biogenesis protein CcmE